MSLPIWAATYLAWKFLAGFTRGLAARAADGADEPTAAPGDDVAGPPAGAGAGAAGLRADVAAPPADVVARLGQLDAKLSAKLDRLQETINQVRLDASRREARLAVGGAALVVLGGFCACWLAQKPGAGRGAE